MKCELYLTKDVSNKKPYTSEKTNIC
jgi:hypothetical protein